MLTATFEPSQISIEILQVDDWTVLIEIRTSIGTGKLLGELRFQDNILYIDQVHVEGLVRGQLGRSGINSVLRQLLVTADVERLVIQGARRTTGRCQGRVPKKIVFPR